MNPLHEWNWNILSTKLFHDASMGKIEYNSSELICLLVISLLHTYCWMSGKMYIILDFKFGFNIILVSYNNNYR